MTRFFMSVQEAVQLVLQASLLSKGRDIFMLEMGEPVAIIDLARRMIELSGARIDVDIPIKLVGIRPGEKLHENLREPEEQVLETEHPFIARLLPITAPPAWFESCINQLEEATVRGDSDGVRRLLFAIAGTGFGDIPADVTVAHAVQDDVHPTPSPTIQLDRSPAVARPETADA
jgi:FlaA1/EpsC-like NDP-sugar epimerase